jgi:hypothetical protein
MINKKTKDYKDLDIAGAYVDHNADLAHVVSNPDLEA